MRITQQEIDEQLWRFITPEKPRPLDVPVTLTISPLENMDALNT